MNQQIESIQKQLANHPKLKKFANPLIFKRELKNFYFKNNKLYCLDKTNEGFQKDSHDVLFNKSKLFFKKYPKLFYFLFYIIGATFVGKNAKKVIKNFNENKIIVNLGSGIKTIRNDVINVDFFPFKNVVIIADIADLPFADNTIDVIINEFVLEHTPQPEKIIKEIYRILKPGGLLYLAIPFLASFHSSPVDYYRWSKQGLRELTKDFKEIEIGIRCGPSTALAYVLSEWISTILCFGSKKIHQIILVSLLTIFFPLKLIDFLISKLPTAENIAYGFYFIGEKP